MKESKVVRDYVSSSRSESPGSAGKKQARAGRRSCRFASAKVLDALRELDKGNDLQVGVLRRTSAIVGARLIGFSAAATVREEGYDAKSPVRPIAQNREMSRPVEPAQMSI